ncbi:hypothetical protein QRX60_29405 [Amycolatopsis mongoliensis]|uniref:Uncharacterized protein n=1 Tax=Amycolatopsis mongoliensis TaxID=715475 RepID=A0A9Y2NE03_9PSEU|nr:hypothetical protein [Amycolatopsis sp. 4-36]WIX98183.1 hypothetical protein QRX60_29405 [Amycolatopsis sp. 4-36]
MHENPPGYEVEQPIDLSKPVALAAQVGTDSPRAERRAAARRPKRAQEAPPQPEPAVPPEPAAVAKPALSGLVAVVNPQSRAGKSLVARMLHSVIETTQANVQLWNGIGETRPEGLVIADMPSDPSGADWRRQTAMADQLVIPVPDDVQAACAAQWLLDRLTAEGRSGLAASAVVAAIRTGRDRKLARKIVRYFETRTAQVVRIKLPGDTPPADDHGPWQPLAKVALRALERPGPSERAARPAAGRQRIVPLDVRDYGKAVS